MMLTKRISQRLRREANLFANRGIIRAVEEEISQGSPASSGNPVILFNASTRLSGLSQNAGFSLVTSLALRAAGVPVFHLVCQRGLSRCVLGTNRDNPHALPPCAGCMRTSRFVFSGADVSGFTFKKNEGIAREFKGLSLTELLEFEYQDFPLGQIILPSMRWVLRRHHLNDDEHTRLIAREYLLSACHLLDVIHELLQKLHPRALVIFNGMFYPEAIVKWAARRVGTPVYSHEVGMLPFSAFFTDQEATAYPVHIDDGFQLNREQEERLDRFLEDRRQGRFITAGIRFWPQMNRLDEDFLQHASRHRFIVPIFTNVIFDTSQGHANALYEHMFEWLDSILPYIQRQTDTLFVIRAHPAELRAGKASRETVAAWVEQRAVSQLPNVRFIPSDQFISSYELVDRSKFVMVYNSTIGLEASIMGRAVLCAGKARYTQIPTVYYPATRNEYIVLLEEFLRAEHVEQPEAFTRNARSMLYCQLFAASLPFGDFLEEDRVWRGYIRLKKFGLEMLSPQRSDTMQVVLDGILHGKPFIMEK